MRSYSRAKILYSASAALVAALFLMGLARLEPPLVPDGQILTIGSDSLTSYLPSAKTNVADVRPRPEQRGVGIDGGLRAGAPHGMAIAGNPFGAVWSGETVHNGVRLDTGAYSPWEVDIALPAPSGPWVIGRSYNAVQKDSGGSFFDANSPMGYNWQQISQPEILFHDNTTDNSKDFVYLVYGADRYVEYQRFDSTSLEFRGRNGAAGVFLFQEDTSGADTYMLTDQRGTEFTFFGFDGDAGRAAGQLWKITDEAGNVAYVGSTTKATAITAGYVSNSGNPDHGAISKAYDSAPNDGRRYTYTYTSGRLTEVKAEAKTGGTWDSPTGVATVAEVDYAYYGDESYGDPGALKLITITTPLTDSGVSSTRKRLLRYWEGTFNASTNPGHPYALKYVVDFEGTRNFDWTDSTFDEDFLTASNASLEPYASAYFEYDSSHRINEAWFAGACGCSGGSTGTHVYEYETNSSYSDGAGYDTAWARRTVVAQPDGSYVTQTFDEVGQPLHRVVTNADPDNTSPVPDRWVTKITRDSSGRVTDVNKPANVTAYTHATGSFSISTSSSVGLVDVFTYKSSGDMTGFLEDRKFKTGTSGSAYLLESILYTSGSRTIDSDLAVVRPFVSSKRKYPTAITSGTTDSTVDTFTYTMYSASLIPEKMDTSFHAVSTGKNGSGSSNTSSVHYTTAGQVDYEKSPSSIITYRAYTNGQLTTLIEDVDTTITGSPPTGFSSTGTELHQSTTHAYDAQGRRTTTTLPGGQVELSYYSRLADQRLATLSYPKYVSGGTPTYYGPVGFSVANQAGKPSAQATIALTGNQSTTALTSHVDEADSDPIVAIDGLGSLGRYSTSIYDEPGGRLEESRLYFDIPASGAGTDGTNYDGTFLGYDNSGRQRRVKEPSGTIRRTVFDAIGRVSARWIGTNDSTFAGGEPSGTDNMVKTEALKYDGDADDGNGYVTERTLFIQDTSTDSRVTTFQHDVRGNVLLETNPTAPHHFSKYDNLSRRLASGSFSSTANIVVGTDDPTTETSNRLALSETAFDEQGRVWKTTRHKIDDADGSDDDTLEAQHWFDADGRGIKVDGPQLTKAFYDRLGRATHEFVLATLNDSVYADADDVSGDTVLEERQTTFDPSDDDVIMRAVISRFHSDKGLGQTSGALDTNADADALMYTATNVKGRIQITGLWYDSLDRLEDEVEFGTYNAANFDRDGMSVPARSDTALRTTYAYATDGTAQDVTDPRALVRRTAYDDAGRVTSEVRNYGDGTPSGTDSDVKVSYAYTDGLRVTITADLPAGDTDEVTTYTYGTTKGASAGDSKIATGHLLQKIQYPDSAGGTDVVTFAYNAQSQEIYKKDQAGNVLERSYDAGGKLTHARVTTLASTPTAFDGAVRRITTAFDNLGRRSTVTQYDNATVGSGSAVDEVKFTYEDWGNVEKFEQDRNGAVGATGSTDDYEVAYTWEKATTGRNTLRRDTMTLPSTASIDFEYSSALSRHDANASRVSWLEHGATVVASYQYNGLGHLVDSVYDEPDVMWRRYGTTGTYPDLDRFDRVVTSKWTKDLTTDVDFYHVDLSYDRNSNITVADDTVHGTVSGGFDVSYSMDNVDRLTRAQEGTWGGSSITTEKRDQEWTLDQVGNWERDKLDLNGDNDWADSNEWDDCRTHNDVNELSTRDLDCTSGTTGNNYTLSYDAAGNLIDDAKDYEYEFDAFYRLRKVKNQSTTLVAEYKYNGLNYRIAEHIDTDTDGDVDASDDWRYFAYDERWRIVASFINTGSTPREEFLPHAAGLDGNGTSAYIDDVVMRERDADANGSLEERIYYCQNWRADVSAIVDETGQLIEWAKYSAYGVPFGLPGADTDSDGDCDTTDINQIQTWINGSTYNVLGDVDLDKDVDATDKTIAQGGAYQGVALGRTKLSAIASRRGFAGATVDGVSTVHSQMRNRIYRADLGRWTVRDYLGYRDGSDLYEALHSCPTGHRDPLGGQAGGLNSQTSEFCHGANGICAQHPGFRAFTTCSEEGNTTCFCNTGGLPDDVKACIQKHEDFHKKTNCATNPPVPPGQNDGPSYYELMALTIELACLTRLLDGTDPTLIDDDHPACPSITEVCGLIAREAAGLGMDTSQHPFCDDLSTDCAT